MEVDTFISPVSHSTTARIWRDKPHLGPENHCDSFPCVTWREFRPRKKIFSPLLRKIPCSMERKKPIKKNHIKEFGGRDAPEASQGQTRDVPGTPGTFGPDLCVKQY